MEGLTDSQLLLLLLLLLLLNQLNLLIYLYNRKPKRRKYSGNFNQTECDINKVGIKSPTPEPTTAATATTMATIRGRRVAKENQLIPPSNNQQINQPTNQPTNSNNQRQHCIFQFSCLRTHYAYTHHSPISIHFIQT